LVTRKGASKVAETLILANDRIDTRAVKPSFLKHYLSCNVTLDNIEGLNV